jgi:hypothetical membrane protein
MKQIIESTQHTETYAETSGRKWQFSPRLLLLAGILCPFFFVIEFLINGFLHPAYNPIRQPISDLELVSAGWIQQATFLIVGLLFISFAFGFLYAFRPVLGKKRTIICFVLLFLSGCGWILGSLFTESVSGHPSALHDILHIVGFHMIFDFLVITLFTTAWKLCSLSRWRLYGRISLGIGLLTLLLVFGPYFYHHGTWTTSFGGLLQRIMEVEALSWYVLIGCRLFIFVKKTSIR